MKNSDNKIKIFQIPRKQEIKRAIFSFSKKEWLLFLVLILILIASTINILGKINQSFMISVPMEGGRVREGIIGTPRFINPVLASTDADRALVSLIYSGLMQKTQNNEIIPNLAESYQNSEDGLTYTFVLKDKISFHDGKPITTTDVAFTIGAIKDPIIKSPRKGNWDGVSVEVMDERTIKFTLKQPFANFLENTTLPIMPAHLWGNSPIELNEANLYPVGSGPYQVSKLNKESSGIVNSYELISFKEYAIGRPYIKKINLFFYQNEDDAIRALKDKKINQLGSISPENTSLIKEKYNTIVSKELPRIFGLFFNQNENQIFTNKNVVNAIEKAINKDRIVSEVLNGYGLVIDNPVPIHILKESIAKNQKDHQASIEEAKKILEKDGWTLGESGYLEKTTTDSNKKKTTSTLSFSIATGNAPELSRSAEIIKENLTEIGINVDVKVFEVGNLNQSVIRPRQYDALLFGQIVNTESDLYAFWHSSQRKDPGLNIAMYTNAKVDKILEEALSNQDQNARQQKYQQMIEEIKKDMPAVFLYSPNFIYIVSKDLQGFNIDNLTLPSDRFLNAYLWYTKTDNVWKVFAKQN
jgi:peptide/nickel transport system substrate-binding protein